MAGEVVFFVVAVEYRLVVVADNIIADVLGPWCYMEKIQVCWM